MDKVAFSLPIISGNDKLCKKQAHEVNCSFSYDVQFLFETFFGVVYIERSKRNAVGRL